MASSTPSSRRRVTETASAWGARNLISTQVFTIANREPSRMPRASPMDVPAFMALPTARMRCSTKRQTTRLCTNDWAASIATLEPSSILS